MPISKDLEMILELSSIIRTSIKKEASVLRKSMKDYALAQIKSLDEDYAKMSRWLVDSYKKAEEVGFDIYFGGKMLQLEEGLVRELGRSIQDTKNYLVSEGKRFVSQDYDRNFTYIFGLGLGIFNLVGMYWVNENIYPAFHDIAVSRGDSLREMTKNLFMDTLILINGFGLIKYTLGLGMYKELQKYKPIPLSK